MQLQAITVVLFRKAFDIFLEEAWGDLGPSHDPMRSLEAGATSEAVLGLFTKDESHDRMRRFWVRIGNKRYPFMKLSVEEAFVKDVFFFSVDAHDALDVGAASPDYQDWLDVKRHNADLKVRIEERWAESGVPTFQQALDAVEEALDARGAETALRGRRILVVDDDRRIARGVQALLAHAGSAVDIAYSGADALDMLKRQRPDLILLDYELGDMTGLEFAAKYRKRREGAATPIILATAARLDIATLPGLDLVNTFLAKPFDMDALVAFVERALPQR